MTIKRCLYRGVILILVFPSEEFTLTNMNFVKVGLLVEILTCLDFAETKNLRDFNNCNRTVLSSCGG